MPIFYASDASTSNPRLFDIIWVISPAGTFKKGAEMGFSLALALIFFLFFFSKGLTDGWILALIGLAALFGAMIWVHSNYAKKNIPQK